MLVGLTVKDLALIKSAEVEFGEGLNILTGETGAGKSIIIGSISLALGAKAKSDIIRAGAESAYIELVFSIENEIKLKELEAMGVNVEDGLVIISRRISSQRSVSRINDETVTLSRLREVTSRLIDIHGQHEHQSLLDPEKHMEILDEYIKDDIGELKSELKRLWGEYTELSKKLSDFDMDEESLIRERDFLEFETEQIENADIKPGEEAELSETYRSYSHRKDVARLIGEAYGLLEDSGISGALAGIEEACGYDSGLSPIKDQLFDAESIVNDVKRELSAYEDRIEFDEAEFAAIGERLDLLRNLEAKYGGTEERILKALEEKRERLSELRDYNENKRKYEEAREEKFSELQALSDKLSDKRKEGARLLCKKISEHLEDLGFNYVSVGMDFKRKEIPDANGRDRAVFVIALNPGEPEKNLNEVASGGELSRVMLAIKTVLADTDDIPTLIFDEIDTGISGRTAWKVSEKLALISGKRQVICITHLPQIAAMADMHFAIKKSEEDGRNVTHIEKLCDRDSLYELSRLLGGADVTDAVLKNAEEMKKLAKAAKDKVYL